MNYVYSVHNVHINIADRVSMFAFCQSKFTFGWMSCTMCLLVAKLTVRIVCSKDVRKQECFTVYFALAN